MKKLLLLTLITITATFAQKETETSTLYANLGGVFGVFHNSDYVEHHQTEFTGGGEITMGSQRGKNLIFASFTFAYGYGLDAIGGGAGYMYSLLHNQAATLRIGAVAGFWGVEYFGEIDGVVEDTTHPMFGGPVVKAEFGRKLVRFYLQDMLLFGDGIYNTVSAGAVLDLGRKK